MKQFLSILLCISLLLGLGGCTLPEEDRFINPTGAVDWTPTEPPVTQPPVPTTVPIPPSELSASALANELTLEQLVAQMFLVKCPTEGAVSVLDAYHVGGIILYDQDTAGQTPASLRSVLSDYQSRCPIPLIIATDEEGGTVNRVSNHSSLRSEPFPAPREVYLNGGLYDLRRIEKDKAQLLHSLGINVNLAPVCDLVTEDNAFMADRSLRLTAQSTGEAVAAMVQTMQRNQVGAVLKHFPGYGNLRGDTHDGSVVDGRTLEMLKSYDLIPFRDGIEAGAGAVMVGHTIVNCLDAANPASLSAAVHELLRKDLDFKGVIITDDLSMGAVTELYEPGEAAVQAVLAGNDLLITAWSDVQYEAVLDAVSAGRISVERIRESAVRIIQWKMDLGLL